MAQNSQGTVRSSAIAIPFLGVLGAVQGAAPNISSTALVGASRALEMSGSLLALAASMQTLAIAATVISTGLLADRIGRRKLLMAALIVGCCGQLLVAIAPVPAFYLLGQAVTGVGLGAVYGAAFAYVRAVAKPGALPQALGLFTAVVGIGTIVFTFLGGSLSSIDWRLSYLVITVMSVIMFLLVPVVLPPQEKIRGERSDVTGQFLLGVGIVAFLYGVTQLGHSLTSPTTLGPIVIGVVLWIAFYIVERRSSHAFFPVELFRQPVFLAAILAGFVYNFGLAVAFLQVTNLWQYVTGLTTLEVSLWQLPLMLAGIVAALVFGRLMGRGMSNRTALLIGGVTTAVGYVLLGLGHSSTSLIGFLPGLIVIGAGVLTCAIPFGNLILKEAPAKFFGPVTSARTTIGQLFYSMGFALATVAIDKLTLGGTVKRLEAAGVQPNEIGTALDAVNAYASASTSPDTSLGKQALATAEVSYATAFQTTMFVAGLLVLLATIGGVLLLRRGEGREHPE
ncbi:MAG: MFS transporter [Candidatus Nanopelagicales bacterium]